MDDGGLEARTSAHFGRAPNFSFYDPEEGTIDVVSNDGQHHGGSRSPPNIIAENGATVLVCENLGRKAVDRFQSLGVDVYCGSVSTVREAIEKWEADELEEAVPGGEYCGHDHGEGHGHDHHGNGHGHDHHDHDHSHDHSH